MELRSYNVEKVYAESVKCRIGNDLGVDKESLERNIPNIKDMLFQIYTLNREVPFNRCNYRTDGEMWTPYLQIVEMLILLGKKIGCVEYDGELKPNTIITINI